MGNKRKHSDKGFLAARVLWIVLLIGAVGLLGIRIFLTPIEISVVYSAEVDYYLPQIIADFNNLSAQHGLNPDTGAPLTVGLRPIVVKGEYVSAGKVRDGIFNAVKAPNNENVLRPTIWSPSASTWLLLTNEDLKQQIFDMSEAKATANAPVVIAIWKSRLDAIRNKVGYPDIGWQELLAVQNSPNGWCDYGLPSPCRPAVYYGHTNPFNSPTGLSTLVSEFYASARANNFTGSTLDLSAVNRTDIQLGVHDIEKLIRHYSDTTTKFIDDIDDGPEYVDFVALEENDVISINQGHRPNGEKLDRQPETLVALYPKEGTFIHDHPFGILTASWITQEQHDAAIVFRDYVLSKNVQTYIMSKNFRPVNTQVPLTSPIDQEFGVDPGQPQTLLNLPDTTTLLAIQQSWGYVKKQANITLLIDISGSMRKAGKLALAQAATKAFLEALSKDPMQSDSRVGLTVFSDEVRQVVPVDSLEENMDDLNAAIDALNADGETALYDALIAVMNAQSQDDCNNWIRAIILLSDGADTSSQRATRQMVLSAIEASQASPCPILVIVVAYGSDADTQTLNMIARAAKTRLLSGDPDNIQKILDEIRKNF